MQRRTPGNPTARRLILVVAAFALIAAACGGDDDAATTTVAPTTTAAPTTTTAAPGTTAAATTTTAAPTTTTTAAPQVGGELTLVTNNAFSTVSYLVEPFGAETGVDLQLLAGGDVGSMVNQAILTKDNPLGDVLYGFDNTFLSRLFDEDLFEPYASPNAANLPAEFQIDPQNRVTVVDFGDVCINYDKAFFENSGIPVPETLDDLRKPEYKGLLVVQNEAQ